MFTAISSLGSHMRVDSQTDIFRINETLLLRGSTAVNESESAL